MASITSLLPTNDESDSMYAMPAEWAPHDACLMVYPHAGFTFRLEQARREFLNIAQAIAVEGREDVVLFCPTLEMAQDVQQVILDRKLLLGSSNNNDGDNNGNDGDSDTPRNKIITRVCPSDDSWARDMGPTFVVHNITNSIVGLDWDFNAWGGPDEGCYWPCERDKVAAQRMCAELNATQDIPSPELTTRKIPMVLEGGSIHVDGEGTVLTTRECLLNKNRNPTKSQQEIERTLLQELGARKVIWLPHGVDGDEDTNGHVDNFACFAKPTEIVLSWTDDNVHDNVNYERCREALALLEHETDAQGRTLTIHKLPLPPPIVRYCPLH